MTVAVRSGSLRHRISFKRYARTADSIGGYARTAIEVCKRWGRIIPLSGDEPFISDKLRTRVTHRIMVRTIPAAIPVGGWFPDGWFGERWFAPTWWGTEGIEAYGITKLIAEFKDRIFRIHSAIQPEEQDGVWSLLCEEMPQ